MITWNVMGINKRARHMKIIAHIKKINVSYVALLETRVNSNNSSAIRKRFGDEWCWLNNYEKHQNGRIWLLWKR